MRSSEVKLRFFNKRRSNVEVVKDILTAASDGATCTGIVYASNLTFPRFKKYSAYLLRKELLIRNSGHNSSNKGIYSTTEKGRRLLQLLTEVCEFL